MYFLIKELDYELFFKGSVLVFGYNSSSHSLFYMDIPFFLSNDKILCGQALSKHLSCTGRILKVGRSLWCGFLRALGGLSCELLV